MKILKSKFSQVDWIRDQIKFPNCITAKELNNFKNKIKVELALDCSMRPTCYTWTGAMSCGKRKTKNSKYGSFSFRGKTVRAHTFAFAVLTDNELPEGYHIDHVCGNSKCVNPKHLRALNASENCSLGGKKSTKNMKL